MEHYKLKFPKFLSDKTVEVLLVTASLSGLRAFVGSLSTLPAAQWSWRARYNPRAARILQTHGFSQAEAVRIASDHTVRGFSSRLVQGSALFQCGVGSQALQALKTAGLLIEDKPLVINLTAELIRLRGLLSQGKYAEAKGVAASLKDRVAVLIANGISVNDRLLAYHFFLQIFLKKVIGQAGDGHKFLFREGQRKHSVQVMVVDSKRERLLMQHRGVFKRLFADTWTVSANCKPPADQLIEAAAAEAVKAEVGLEIDRRRFELIGRKNGFHSQLISYDFYAFTPEEEVRLRRAATETPPHFNLKMTYDERRRVLFLHSLDSDMKREVVADYARRITEKTGVPSVYPVFDVADNSLLVVQLTPEEEVQAGELLAEKRAGLTAATAAIESSTAGSLLKAVDADEMNFIPIEKVRSSAAVFPEGFALDLIGPYLFADHVWNSLAKPQLIEADSPAAGDVAIAGGKGANTHILRQLAKKHPELVVPETVIVSTQAFEELILADPVTKQKIEQLEKLSDEKAIRALSESIRNDILTVELPEELKAAISQAFQRLGGRVAVRSSATVEDTKESAAAGQADSFLDVTDPEKTISKVKMVWASLFSDGFVKYRQNKHLGAKMAVLLQTYLPATAAGVATSITAKGRSVYNITAKFGVGEKVVQGQGKVDTYQVGLLADVILEEQLEERSLTREQVLILAKIIRPIYEHYRAVGLAKNIDVEFVFAGGQFYIVQARAEKLDQLESAAGRQVMKITVVDEEKIPPGAVCINLDARSITAQAGAVAARLQYVEMHRPGDCQPNVILLTEHTSNMWNAQFASLAGVITTDGGSTSHAAKNSRHLNKPCLVGVPSAIELLRPYDGQVVTLDSDKKRVFIGQVPTKTVERDLSIWVADLTSLAELTQKQEQHEALTSWVERKRRRPGILIEDFEGHWRARSGPLPFFQINYYYQAWERLTAYLNNRFAARAPFQLPIQPRQIKEGFLFHEILEPDDKSIFWFLTGLHDPALSLEDAEALLSERLAGFRRFSQFATTIDSLNGGNVEAIVNELINVFTWMHFAFWLNSVVDTHFLSGQIKYLSPESLEPFMEAAMVNPAPVYADDLSRAKDQEHFAMLERVTANPAALAAFDNAEPAAIRRDLAAAAPEILSIIESWSQKYKAVSENMLVASDTNAYLSHLKKCLAERAVITLDLVRVFLLRSCGPVALTRQGLVHLLEQDPDLFLIFRGYARKIAAETEADSSLDRAIDEVLASFNTYTAKVRALKEILADNPNLKRILRLSQQEQNLREDGHHLIVPPQRKIAQMMLQVAAQRTDIFDQPEDVFALSTAELVALFKDPNPQYLKMSAGRLEALKYAETELTASWSLGEHELPADLWAALTTAGYLKDGFASSGNLTDAAYNLTSAQDLKLPFPYHSLKIVVFELIQRKRQGLPAAIKRFARLTAGVVTIIREQIKAASDPGVIEYYEAEIARLLARVNGLEKQLEKRSIVREQV